MKLFLSSTKVRCHYSFLDSLTISSIEVRWWCTTLHVLDAAKSNGCRPIVRIFHQQPNGVLVELKRRCKVPVRNH